jgi:hypothetical protein
MFARLLFVSLFTLTACPSNDTQSLPPDAAVAHPDAHVPPPPPPLLGYGDACTSASQCQSGLCVGETGSAYTCSRLCSLAVAQDCKDVNAFCVPIGGGDNACYGSIVTGNDTDDAVMQIGDTITRVLSPLADADLFLVHLDQLGTARFTATPQPSIDVKIEAYGETGAALGFANDVGPGAAEALVTTVQQIGTHIFIVVRDVGSSTGGYTLNVQHVAGAAVAAPPKPPEVRAAP